MPWIYLVLAGLFEIGGPIGLKTAQVSATKGITITALFMIMSSYCFYEAQKVIPIGTAYAVWSGIGAAVTFLLGIFMYSDSVTFMRCAGITLIAAGVILLKLSD